MGLWAEICQSVTFLVEVLCLVGSSLLLKRGSCTGLFSMAVAMSVLLINASLLPLGPVSVGRREAGGGPGSVAGEEGPGSGAGSDSCVSTAVR